MLLTKMHCVTLRSYKQDECISFLIKHLAHCCVSWCINSICRSAEKCEATGVLCHSWAHVCICAITQNWVKHCCTVSTESDKFDSMVFVMNVLDQKQAINAVLKYLFCEKSLLYLHYGRLISCTVLMIVLRVSTGSL